VGSAGFSPSLDSTVSLAVADDSTPYVAYVDSDNGDGASVELATPLAPRVTRIEPADGVTLDDAVLGISARFDRPMNPATVQNTMNFRVTANGVVPQYGIRYSPDSNTAAFLVFGSALTGKVTVELTEAIESDSGVAFPGREWNFEVR
jgi:hypothetical protein